MCGIVGLISKKQGGLFNEDLSMFEAMLINDTQRGPDSTGIFSVKRNGEANMMKVASNPFNLFACPEYGKFRSEAISSGKMLVGHNRKATQGGINSGNAHPFVEGSIILVHNGTLWDHKKMGTGKEVDSHAICHAFNEKGHEEVIPTIDGAFALVWYDVRVEKLFMIRNSQRPLALVETADMIAFASEAWMAQGQFYRNDKKIVSSHLIEEGVLYEFNINTGLYNTKKLELYSPPPLKSTQTHFPSHGHHSQRSSWEEAMYNDDNAMNDPIPPILPELQGGRWKALKEHKQEARILRLPFKDTNLVANQAVSARIKSLHMEKHIHGKDNGNMAKCFGQINNIFGEPVDFVAWLPDVTANTFQHYAGAHITGLVESVVNGACGPSAWLKEIELDDTIQCYEGQVSEWNWYHVIAGKAKCCKCEALIQEHDMKFTSINLKGKNARVTCHECVGNSLTGEMKNGFIERRNAALQARKSISSKSVQSPVNPPEVQSTPTVH